MVLCFLQPATLMLHGQIFLFLVDTQTASPDVGSSGDIKAKEEKDVVSSGDAEEKSDGVVKVEVKEEKDADSAVSSGTSSSSSCASGQRNGDADSTVKKEVNGDVNHGAKQASTILSLFIWILHIVFSV